jgi:hypothetical protein
MNKISEEKLYAYADGELDAAGRAEVEAALRADPQLVRQLEQQRALRDMLGAAYDPVLAEPMPARLLAAAQAQPAAPPKVVDLGAARAEREALKRERAGWGWAQWGGMAACLMIGLFVGREMLPPAVQADVVVRDGKLLASGALDRLLTRASAADADPSSPNRVGLTFVSKGGDYCRTFSWGAAADSSSGLACRSGSTAAATSSGQATSTSSGQAWELRKLARNAPGTTGPMRMAGSGLPAEILQAVEAEMAGSPLDAQAERAALDGGWRRR